MGTRKVKLHVQLPGKRKSYKFLLFAPADATVGGLKPEICDVARRLWPRKPPLQLPYLLTGAQDSGAGYIIPDGASIAGELLAGSDALRTWPC